MSVVTQDSIPFVKYRKCTEIPIMIKKQISSYAQGGILKMFDTRELQLFELHYHLLENVPCNGPKEVIHNLAQYSLHSKSYLVFG